jgi:hypothetical protein
LAGRVIGQGYDEVETLTAISLLAEKYIYVDFNQVFPDTYRFELPKKKIYHLIIRQLAERGEVILEKDVETGLIYTAAKEVPLPYHDEETDSQDKIYYQLSIFLTQKSTNVTYVTLYPTVLKGDYMEVLIPLARNMLRGIFFGSLAAEIYPDLKEKGLFIAKSVYGKEVKPETIGEVTTEIAEDTASEPDEMVHIVQPGDTLGDISRKYTGKVMNYKRIAAFNNIIDPKKIAIGQRIVIPADLTK